jgi:hypothetical protein
VEISRKLFPYCMDPCAPVPSQRRYNLATGKQPDPVAVYVPYRQQLVGHTRKSHLVRCWVSVGLTGRTPRRAHLKGPQIGQQAMDRLRDLLRIQWL